MLITVGQGKKQPIGCRLAVEDLADALDALDATVECWWSPHLWASDHRSVDGWEGAQGIACDVDFGDGKGAHLPLTEPARHSALFAWEEGVLPGSLFHLTPRGFRVVFTLDQPAGIPDRDTYLCAARGGSEAVRQAVEATGLASLGFAVDLPVTADLARLFYAPRANVNGEARNARVLRRERVYTLSALAALESAPIAPAGDDPTVGTPRPSNTVFDSAVARYNAEHPREWPKNSAPCPGCGAPSSFGRFPPEPSRWYCFAAGHGDRAPTCGIKGPKGWHGDALDVDAYEAKCSRRDLLVQRGYLAPLRTALGPGAEVSEQTGESRTDMGNARRLVAVAGQDLRFTAAHGWLAWDGKRWRPDDTEAVYRFARRAILSIFDEAKAAAEASRSKEADLLADWAIKSQKRSALDALVALARSEPEVVARAEDFDRDSWLLTVGNGTLDLRTGELREHRRGDLLTKLAPVAYDAQAEAPTWLAFLTRVQPDPEVRAYLQRRAGYCLTGETTEQAFDVDHGAGANGKTTFHETIADALGDYATTTPFSTFLVRRDRGEASNDLADLKGARLVVASEPPEGARLNIALVKALTGGERIKARFLYREYMEFVPMFKIVLVTNHQPRIPETGDAAWRRVRLVPWGVTIPKAERDRGLRAKLRLELSGILRWTVEGLAGWRNRGELAPPPAVLAATAEYQREEDAVGSFIAERCITGSPYQVKAADLLSAFQSWARMNGEAELTAKALGGRLKELGFRDRKRGIKWWDGLAVRNSEETPPDGSRDDGDDGTVRRGSNQDARACEGFPGERSDPPHPPVDRSGCAHAQHGSLADLERSVAIPGERA